MYSDAGPFCMQLLYAGGSLIRRTSWFSWGSGADVWGGGWCPCVHAVTITDPAASIIDGKAIAQEILWEISKEVEQMKKSVGKVPGLAVVLVGSRTDSETYVRSKKRACEEVGFQSFSITLPEESPEAEVVRHVKRYDDDPLVHGVLVQLPLPQVVIFLLCCMTQFFPVSTIWPSSFRIWDLPWVKWRHVLWWGMT